MSADGRDDAREFGTEDGPDDAGSADAADIIDEAEPVQMADDDADEGAVAGSFAPEVSVTPQRPAPENVAFVALGVYLTLLALASAIPGGGVAPQAVVVVAVVVSVVTLLCYGVLVRTTPDT
jgi:hypothetical protein